MNIIHFGAGGHIGRAIAAELLRRGHAVTAVSRSGSTDLDEHPGLTFVRSDVTDTARVKALVQGHDAVVSTVGPKIGQENDRAILVGAAESLVAALTQPASPHRLVVLGGAGSLRTPDGGLVMDGEHFPSEWRQNAEAQAAALELYRASEGVDWTFISPAAIIDDQPGTGNYRVGGEQLLVDEVGNSHISISDYAIAFCDEVEKGAHLRERIGVAQ